MPSIYSDRDFKSGFKCKMLIVNGSDSFVADSKLIR